jgi:glycosyltransferase involved in cell wall biosynthesis
MIPGSWLEVFEYDEEKVAAIFSHGYVQKIILTESSQQSPPPFPFIIRLSHLEDLAHSKWRFSNHFEGFIWTTEKIPDQFPSHFLSELKNIWVEYFPKNKGEALNDLERLEKWSFKGHFIAPGKKLSFRKLNEILHTFPRAFLPRPHDLLDESFKNWIDLESFNKSEMSFNICPDSKPQLSIIIPHFENPHFLSNVLKHLDLAVNHSPEFEVIVVDDGSSQKTCNQISYFASRHLIQLPIRFAKWQKDKYLPNGKTIFRAGASRNWGAYLAKSENLFFLDSDMLTPINIVHVVIKALDSHDVIQFVRKHVPHYLSSESCSYDALINSPNLYTEESSYWNQLFESPHWDSLKDYWKYTCTYALAIRKNNFVSAGRFRRNFIQYGFEDTDLGYRLFKSSKRFALNKTPLLHLSSRPDSTQNYFFKLKKMNRIRPMAARFYELNIDPRLYQTFQSLLD